MELTTEQAATCEAITLTDHLFRFAESAGERTAVTFMDYAVSQDGVARSLSRLELSERVRAVAAWLSNRCEPGERVAIMAPQGIDYVVGFLGAVHAGRVAVPLFTPDLPGHSDRLERVLDDCAPACVLTTQDALDQVQELLRKRGGPSAKACGVVDALRPEIGNGYQPPPVAPDDLAYVQYTSGSTRIPAGVELTHANVVANAKQTLQAYGGDQPGAVAVSWLPLFHDMGLVLALAAPVVGGIPSVLMDPVAFLQRPGRWLRMLSMNPRAISAAPNFAYDYCVARVSDKEKAWLRLDDVITLINGSEPVRPSTIARFNETFADCGLRPNTHRCSYGLAEATVFVSVTDAEQEPKITAFRRDALTKGVAEKAAEGADAVNELVSCGKPVGQEAAVVDPVSRALLPEGMVGEIWVRGPNVGRGYWGRNEDSKSVFDLEIRDVGENREKAGVGWMRTGDLGVWYEDELYVTGRMKDLVIVDGRNHYPQDVEATVEAAHPAIRNHHTAAFGVTVGEAERLVVMAEYARQVPEDERDPLAMTRAARKAVSAAHGVALYDLVLVEPYSVPRTSSGKVARRSCREQYLELSREDEHERG